MNRQIILPTKHLPLVRDVILNVFFNDKLYEINTHLLNLCSNMNVAIH